MQAKSRLYARRMKGDLDLGLEPARIDGKGNRHWAEENFPGGLLPGGSYQDILELSEVNKPNYRIGTRRVAGDRVFHYCYANAKGGIDHLEAEVEVGTPKVLRGCFYNSNLHYHGYKTEQGAVPKDATDLLWRYRKTSEGGGAHVGNIDIIAAGDLKEAMLVCYSEPFSYLIADNDALEDGFVHLYLKQAVWKDIVGDENTYIYPNKYAICVHRDPGICHDDKATVGNQTYGAVVAVPLRDVDQGCYFWGQTWGPYPAWNGLWSADAGDTPNKRTFWFDWDGAMVYHDGAEETDPHLQRGGVILSSQFVDLQLAP